MKLILIGCSKTKLPYTYDRKRGGKITPTEMYGGQLFRKGVAYAKSLSLPWAVLSAEYGLWNAEAGRAPYDTTMKSLSSAERAAWHLSVASSLVNELWEPWETNLMARPLRADELTVEIHAGSDYAHPLAEILRLLGVIVELPLEGLGIGQRLAWYSKVAA